MQSVQNTNRNRITILRGFIMLYQYYGTFPPCVPFGDSLKHARASKHKFNVRKWADELNMGLRMLDMFCFMSAPKLSMN